MGIPAFIYLLDFLYYLAPITITQINYIIKQHISQSIVICQKVCIWLSENLVDYLNCYSEREKRL
jgi:hypothetical protein